MIPQWAWEEVKCTFETILTSFVPISIKWKVKMHDFVRKLDKVHMPAHGSHVRSVKHGYISRVNLFWY
ncbi:MAG: hypothetical protein QG577_313 [Thermodesulfobacteriota bacterium]|nr:hypothetical protein [Thermodesulfobacteriota bacterium]